MLYTGVTGDLTQRVYQYKQRQVAGFTQRYNVTSLVYFEECDGPNAAIVREKQIKGWTRARKLALISTLNPEFADLSEGWFSK